MTGQPPKRNSKGLSNFLETSSSPASVVIPKANFPDDLKSVVTFSSQDKDTEQFKTLATQISSRNLGLDLARLSMHDREGDYKDAELYSLDDDESMANEDNESPKKSKRTSSNGLGEFLNNSSGDIGFKAAVEGDDVKSVITFSTVENDRENFTKLSTQVSTRDMNVSDLIISNQQNQTQQHARVTPARQRSSNKLQKKPVRQTSSNKTRPMMPARQPSSNKLRPIPVRQSSTNKGERPAAVRQGSTNKGERPAQVRQASSNRGERPAQVRQASSNKGERPAQVRQASSNRGERPAQVRQASSNRGERPAQVRQGSTNKARGPPSRQGSTNKLRAAPGRKASFNNKARAPPARQASKNGGARPAPTRQPSKKRMSGQVTKQQQEVVKQEVAV